MHGETCEQRRAREYGIDVPLGEGIFSEATSSTTATGYSPLSEWEAKRRDPEPQPRDYLDPIVYALAHADWSRRNA